MHPRQMIGGRRRKAEAWQREHDGELQNWRQRETDTGWEGEDEHARGNDKQVIFSSERDTNKAVLVGWAEAPLVPRGSQLLAPHQALAGTWTQLWSPHLSIRIAPITSHPKPPDGSPLRGQPTLAPPPILPPPPTNPPSTPDLWCTDFIQLYSLLVLLQAL